MEKRHYTFGNLNFVTNLCDHSEYRSENVAGYFAYTLEHTESNNWNAYAIHSDRYGKEVKQFLCEGTFDYVGNEASKISEALKTEETPERFIRFDNMQGLTRVPTPENEAAIVDMYEGLIRMFEGNRGHIDYVKEASEESGKVAVSTLTKLNMVTVGQVVGNAFSAGFNIKTLKSLTVVAGYQKWVFRMVFGNETITIKIDDYQLKPFGTEVKYVWK